MSAITAALHSLSLRGYTLYSPIIPNASYLVIESPDEQFHKTIVKRASQSKGTHLITFSKPRSYWDPASLVLAVDPLTLTTWLIPLSHIPPDSKSIRLGEKYTKYLIKEAIPSNKAAAAIAKVISKTVEVASNQDSDLISKILNDQQEGD